PSPAKNPIVFDHLVNTFGFTVHKAIKASKDFSYSASPSTLSIVPDFLKWTLCYTDAQITTIFSRRPTLLSSNILRDVTRNLKHIFLEM
ncbi:hypothetical protein GIB67_030870, partial [Kingdonia uniflora]